MHFYKHNLKHETQKANFATQREKEHTLFLTPRVGYYNGNQCNFCIMENPIIIDFFEQTKSTTINNAFSASKLDWIIGLGKKVVYCKKTLICNLIWRSLRPRIGTFFT